MYVEDLADGVALGLNEVATNRVYNLASDENVTIKQIAETVQNLIGNVEIVHTPARPGDFGGKIVSSERAEHELGWTAATPFAEGVGKYVAWRREQAAATAALQDAVVIPAGEPDAESKPRQVLIISADIGEGHDLPARAVAREFKDEDPDAHVSIVNGLPAMGPILTKVLRENSAFMFQWLPWLFDMQYWLFMYFPPTRWLAKRLLTALGRRGLMRLIRAHDPDQIVSTYPGVTAVLGELRRKGKLNVPCYSSITDLAGLRFWAHPGIDLHFVTHPESIEEVEQIAGPGSVRWAKPPTSPAFLAARSRDDARRALGLPAGRQGDCRVGRRLGGRRPRRRDPGRADRPAGRDRAVPLRPQRQAARARGQALRRRAAAAADGLHRPDGRRARRCRRTDPLERRTDRARGDHPRLPGHLLRLRRRACARVEPCARALRARAGRALRARHRSGALACARAPARARRLVRAPARRPRR